MRLPRSFLFFFLLPPAVRYHIHSPAFRSSLHPIPGTRTPNPALQMKFGPIKRQHGRVHGLDDLLDHILAHCPGLDRIIPGRMGRKAGKTPARLKIQYPTTTANKPTGFKCIYTSKGSWQEVFLICSDPEKTQTWLDQQPFTQKYDD